MSLHEIQTKVHVAKDKKNEFGGYNYRTAEGILAATKAALPDGWTIVCSDDVCEVAGQIFVTATAVISGHSETGQPYSFKSRGHAMHPLQKKGMDPSQITGAASSYARKYALAGLLALDDGSVDPDATNNKDGAAGSLSPNVQAWEDAILDSLHENPSEAELANAYSLQMNTDVSGYKSAKGVEGYMKKHQTHLDFMSQHQPEAYNKLRSKAWARMQELKGEKEA